MAIGRKVETADDREIEEGARAATKDGYVIRGRDTAPNPPDKITLRHTPTGNLSQHHVVDVFEILGAKGCEYELGDDRARAVFAQSQALRTPEARQARINELSKMFGRVVR